MRFTSSDRCQSASETDLSRCPPNRGAVQPDEDAIAAHLNATPKYVVSRTLRTLDWAGAHVLDGDVVDRSAT